MATVKKNVASGRSVAVKRAGDTVSVREMGGPRSLTRLLGLFDALAKKSDGMTLADLNGVL